MIDRLFDAGAPVETCSRFLGVSRQEYSRYLKHSTSATEMRRQWFTGLIPEIHVASRGTYGYRRTNAELTIANGHYMFGAPDIGVDDARRGRHRR